MIIQCDSREQKNEEVIAYFNLKNVAWFSSKVPAGDYINFERPKVAVDLKKDLLEVANNLTGDHDRFLREVDLAKRLNLRMVVLIREPLQSLEDVKEWSNPRTKVKGETLYKIMKTMQEKYGIIWRFCTRKTAGIKILKILEYFDTIS